MKLWELKEKVDEAIAREGDNAPVYIVNEDGDAVLSCQAEIENIHDVGRAHNGLVIR